MPEKSKTVRIKVSSRAAPAFHALEAANVTQKVERGIFKAVKRKTEVLRWNVRYGQPIAKHLIPEVYRTQFAATNLFRVELPDYWRMLYALYDDDSMEPTVIILILDILSHPAYDKLFGYAKK